MVKRDSYLKRLIHNMWNGEVKVITGIRRCGKSVMLFDLFYEYLFFPCLHIFHLCLFTCFNLTNSSMHLLNPLTFTLP